MTTQTLTLESVDPCRTSFLDESGNTVYTTETDESGSKVITHIRDAGGKAIASLEWHDLRGDKVTFGGGQKIALNTWLKKKKGEHRTVELSFSDDGGRQYTWTGIGTNHGTGQIKLYADGGSSSEPIAFFQPSIRGMNRDDAQSRPYLSLTSLGQEIRDKVILSCIFIEKSRRYSGGLTQAPFLDRVLLGFSANKLNPTAPSVSVA